jgi:hypothetical protein
VTEVKLRRLSQSKRVDCRDKPITFLNRIYDEMKHFQCDLTLFIKCKDGNVCGASHKVSSHAAHCGEANMSTETPSHIK